MRGCRRHNCYLHGGRRRPLYYAPTLHLRHRSRPDSRHSSGVIVVVVVVVVVVVILVVVVVVIVLVVAVVSAELDTRVVNMVGESVVVARSLNPGNMANRLLWGGIDVVTGSS